MGTRDVAEMLGWTETQVRSYARSGLVSPERGPRGEYRFSFQDMIVLRTAKQLQQARVPPRHVRSALLKLRRQLPRERSLSAVRLAVEGDQVVARDEDTVWNPDSGQLQFDFAASNSETGVAPITLRTADETCLVDSDLSADDWYVSGLDLESVAPQEAKRAYESSLELDPNHADAHVNLGRLLHAEGRPAEAATHYEQALESQPEHATAAFDLGVALEDLDRPSDAIRAYERAIRSDPEYADAHYNLAALYDKAGKPAAALRHLASYRRIGDTND